MITNIITAQTVRVLNLNDLCLDGFRAHAACDGLVGSPDGSDEFLVSQMTGLVFLNV